MKCWSSIKLLKTSFPQFLKMGFQGVGVFHVLLSNSTSYLIKTRK